MSQRQPRTVLAGLAAALAVMGAAQADHAPSSRFEARLGVLQHDFDALNNGAGGKETGVNTVVEILAPSPAALRVLGSPRPYANFSWNSAGDTNFGGAGLAWRTPAWRKAVFGELGFGVVVHDGVVDLPADPGDLDRIRLDATRTVFGSRELFRTVLAAGYQINTDWDAHIVFEHLSHGQILGSGRNEGLDNIGVRVGRRFGG